MSFECTKCADCARRCQHTKLNPDCVWACLEHGPDRIFRRKPPESSEDSGKLTNPKDAIASDKWPAHLWPTTATVAGSLAMLHGAMKYGRSNWRASGAKASVYYDALMRHVMAWWEGEDDCPDSGVPHLGHAMACLAILVDSEAAGKLVDDRAYPGGYGKLTLQLTKLVAKLRARDQKPRHYTREDFGLVPVGEPDIRKPDRCPECGYTVGSHRDDCPRFPIGKPETMYEGQMAGFEAPGYTLGTTAPVNTDPQFHGKPDRVDGKPHCYGCSGYFSDPANHEESCPKSRRT